MAISSLRESQIQELLDQSSEQVIAKATERPVPDGGFERLHWLYLAQLHDHMARFKVELPDLGTVDFPEDATKLSDRPVGTTWFYKKTVKVDVDGQMRSATVTCDVLRRVVKAFWNDTGDAVADNAVGWCIAGLAVESAYVIDGYSETALRIDIRTTLARLDGRGDGFVVPVDPNGVYTLDELVRVGVIQEATKGEGFMPSRKLPMVRVAHATGLAASTLSELRKGTLDPLRMPYQSVTLLALYGNLSRLRGAMYDAYAAHFERKDGVDAGTLYIRLTDGTAYELIGTSKQVLQEYDLVNRIRFSKRAGDTFRVNREWQITGDVVGEGALRWVKWQEVAEILVRFDG